MTRSCHVRDPLKFSKHHVLMSFETRTDDILSLQSIILRLINFNLQLTSSFLLFFSLSMGSNGVNTKNTFSFAECVCILKKQQCFHEKETDKNIMLHIYCVSGRTLQEITCFCLSTVQVRVPCPIAGLTSIGPGDLESGTLSLAPFASSHSLRKGLALSLLPSGNGSPSLLMDSKYNLYNT